jgi:hypothetical protein
VHSEQMFALDGAIVLGTSTATGRKQIENRTQFALQSAAVVRRPTAAELQTRPGVKLQGMWIGEMLPGRSVALAYPDQFDEKQTPFDKKRQDEERLLRSPRLNLEPMFRLAMDVKNLEPGEARLVARVDEVLAGETITPSASQVRGTTLVVAHLEYAPPEPPRPDLNTRQEIKVAADEDSPFEVVPTE